MSREAATQVPQAVRPAHPEVPWCRVMAIGNRLIHGYLGIDDDTLWSLVQSDVPALRATLRALPSPPA